MRKIFLVALALTALALSACASGSRVRPDIHGMISRVEHGGNVAYIFGSMHSGRANWFPLNPAVEEAMARADVFAFEVDMALMESPEVLMRTQQLIMLPPGTQLRDVLSDEGYARLTRNIGTFPNVRYEHIAGFTPMGALYVISIIEMTDIMGTQTQYSVDNYIHQVALAAGKPVIGLNDIFRGLDLAYGIPMELQREAFDDFEDFRAMSESVADLALAEAYAAQDVARLRAALDAEMSADSDSALVQHLYHVNFDVRCNIFADEIARLLRETAEPTTFFITVGIGHLVSGGHGQVLDLLEGMGFEVEPLWK